MKIIGLTGGIASGKSSAIEMIRGMIHDVSIFDSDATVRSLFSQDAGIRAGLLSMFGSKVMTPEGLPDRQVMRDAVFSNPETRRALESLVHPRVREYCLQQKTDAAQNGKTLFVADVPLLFENGFDFGQQINIVVAVSRATQCSRLISRSRVEPVVADSIIDSQLPLSQKLKLADVVWWNEGPQSLLHAQVSRFFKNFLR